MLPVAVLVSGSGSNLQALLDATADDPGFGARLAVVISDRPGVGALERAARAGAPTAVIRWGQFEDRESFSVARIQLEEPRILPQVVKAWAVGRLRVEGRQVIWEEL